MTSRYLLDTNIASCVIKGNIPAVRLRLRMTILPWDSEAAQRYGQIRAALEREGQAMGNLDMMIGAHALALGAVLVTNDQAFTRIKELNVEDWTKA